MKRLTFDENFCEDVALCGEVLGGSFCEDGTCSQRQIWERLKMIEDVFGDEYDIDRLREMQQCENLRPLTLDELRKMDGQPVWGQRLISDKPGEWFIVRIVEMRATWFIACAGATQGFGDKDNYGDSWIAYRRPPEKALEEMEEIPAADVAPVVHGKWVKKPVYRQDLHGKMIHFCTKYICSACNHESNTLSSGRFCPNCGAKMDLID